jgi:Ferritin-like domain
MNENQTAAEGVSRRRFIALAGGSAAATLLVACGDDGSTAGTATEGDAVVEERFGKGDVGILNYALFLEYVEWRFLAQVANSGLLKGAELAMIGQFRVEEGDHIESLTREVGEAGAKPVREPKTEFPLNDAESVLELASTIENLAAAAYLGQMPNIESRWLLAVLVSIHSVEGRHAAALRAPPGESITPDGAFAEPADAETVLKSVDPFIVG